MILGDSSGENGEARSFRAESITVCLIACNEGDRITRAIASARSLADEIVVYDTGSSDATVALAEAAGARAITGVWSDDFAAARNAALRHCRGEWVLSLDADEELVCPSPVAVRAALTKAPDDLLAFQVPIHNLLGIGTTPGYTHVAERLFRRSRCCWRGRLHEQLVDVQTNVLAKSARLNQMHLTHDGYAAGALVDGAKAERNVRLARAEVEDPQLGDRGAALVALGRALWGAGAEEPALSALLAGAETTSYPTARRQALSAAARIALRRGDLGRAETLVGALAAASHRQVAAERIAAGIALARGEYARCLLSLDHVEGAGPDDDGYEYGPASLAEWRAAALLGVGRADAALGILLGELGSSGAVPAPLDLFYEAACEAGALDELARRLPRPLPSFLAAEMLSLAPERAIRLLELLWQHAAGRPDDSLLAAGTLVARRLTGAPLVDWARRIRAVGHVELCPLLARAQASELCPERRAEAALAALDVFGDDERAAQALVRAVDAFDADRRNSFVAAHKDSITQIGGVPDPAPAVSIQRALLSGAPPELSIITVVRGGPAAVIAGLEALGAALPAGVASEVIVVDPGTDALVSAVVDGLSGDVVTIRRAPDAGDAALWNLAAASAGAPALAVYDLGARLAPGCLSHLLGSLTGDARLGAVGAVLEVAGQALAGARVELERATRPSTR
jgi:hypothetical protein